MKIAVGGATGFIGSALVRALLDRGDEVTVLALHPDRAHEEFGNRVTVHQWRPPEPGRWMAAIDGLDAVINMAGYPVAQPTKPWTAARKALILSSRIDSTSALVEAVRQAQQKPHVFVNQSAIGYYGSQGSRVLTESSPPGSDFIADVVKRWEAAAVPVEDLGVRLVLLRTGIVLGHGGLVKQLTPPFQFYGGGTMGYPEQWVSWIHIDDEVNIVLFALDHQEVHGHINATAPDPVTMKTLSRELGRALRRPSWAPFLWLPMKLFLGQRAQAVLASERVLPEELLRAGYRFRYTDVGDALRASV